MKPLLTLTQTGGVANIPTHSAEYIVRTRHIAPAIKVHDLRREPAGVMGIADQTRQGPWIVAETYVLGLRVAAK